MDRGHSAGGSAELARLIDQAGEQLYADLLRYYGVRLQDVLIEGTGLTARMVIALVRNLPVDSATVAVMRGGPEYVGWRTETYLLASVLDAIRENTYAFVSANSKRKPSAPEPTPRPEAKRKKSGVFAAMARAAFRKKRD